MTEEGTNYGMAEERRLEGKSAEQDERLWSALAHLSIFLNLVTGFLGPVAALVIWLAYRGRSERVAFHALQSVWYQAAWLVVLGVGWALTGALTAILIGIIFIPGMVVLSVVPFVYSAYVAYRVWRGDYYRYPWVADLIENR